MLDSPLTGWFEHFIAPFRCVQAVMQSVAAWHP
jgi:hypothetical protein